MTYILLVLLFVYLFGYSILLLLYRGGELNILEKVGLSWFVGNGIYTFLIFLMGYFGLILSRENVFYLTSILTVFVFFVFYFRCKCRVTSLFGRNMLPVLKKQSVIRSLRSVYPNVSPFIITLFVFLLVCSSFLYNFLVPPRNWDSIALYDSRARMLVKTPSIDSIAFERYYLVYPLGSSLSNFWVYIFGGNNPSFIDSIYYASFILVFYGVIRRTTSKILALMSVFIFSLNPQFYIHSTLGYANLWYAVLFASSLIYLWLWLRDNDKRGSLLLSALLLGLSFWVRSVEPFWVLPLFVVLFFSLKKRKIWYFILYLLIVYTFRYFWYSFVSRFYQHQAVASLESSFPRYVHLLLSKNILQDISVTLIDVANGLFQNGRGVLFVVFGASWYLSSRKGVLARNVWQLIIVLGLVLLLIFGSIAFRISIIRPSDWNQLQDSLPRILMFFVPVLIFFVANNLYLFFARDSKA